MYLKESNVESEIYWDPTQYQKDSNDDDLIILGEIYLELRRLGKDLSWVGEQLYKKGEEKGIPGFEKNYSNQNN